MCSGRRGLRPRRAGPVPGRRRRGAPRSGEHALLDGAGGDGGAGQIVQVARESIVAQPPAPWEPPPHRGLTFGTRTAFSPRRRRGDPSSLEDNAVLDRKVRPRWRRRRRQHDGQRAGGEELRLRTAPGRRAGARAHGPCRLSLTPTRESSRSRSLSSSSPRSRQYPPRQPGSQRRRHHRRRRRPHPKPRSPRRSRRRRPPPRLAHRPPP